MADSIARGLAVALSANNKPTDAQVEQAVDAWLDEHPEATTTVEDGAITKAKLDANLQGTVDDVDDLKSAISDKLDAPSTPGTATQVLVSDGEGGQVWGDIDAGEVVIDSTLSVSGAAADAKAAGDAVSAVKSAIDESGIVQTLTATTGISGKYINNADGSQQSSASYNISSPILLDVGQTIAITALGTTNGVAVIAEYDGLSYSKLVTGGVSSGAYTYTAPCKMYVVISYNATNSYTGVIYNDFSDVSDDIRSKLVSGGLVRYIDFSQSDVGHSIRSTGVYTSDAAYMVTPAIPLLVGETVVIAGYGYSTSFAMISKKDGTTYTPLVNSNGNEDVFSYTATKNISVVLCCNKQRVHYAYVIHNSLAFDTYANNMLETQTTETVVSFANADTGHYIAADGTYSANASFDLALVHLYAGQLIKFNARGYLTNTAMISEKTSSNTYTPLVLSTESDIVEYTYICPRNMIAALSYRNDYAHEAVVYSTPMDVILAQTKISNFFGHWSLFPRLAVIGDSLSSGSTAGEGSEYGSSWLSYIARFTNAAARNHYSEGGLNCKQWLTKYKTKMESDTPFNAYFIALGHNDYSAQPYGIGEITDTAGTDSFVGYYKQIIESVRAHAPYAAIFCVSLYSNASVYSAYNEMIEDISELYSGVFFLDYANTASIYTNTGGLWSTTNHFSTIGYNYVASIIYQMVCDVVDNNRDYFRLFGLHNYVGGQYDEE